MLAVRAVYLAFSLTVIADEPLELSMWHDYIVHVNYVCKWTVTNGGTAWDFWGILTKCETNLYVSGKFLNNKQNVCGARDLHSRKLVCMHSVVHMSVRRNKEGCGCGCGLPQHPDTCLPYTQYLAVIYFQLHNLHQILNFDSWSEILPNSNSFDD